MEMNARDPTKEAPEILANKPDSEGSYSSRGRTRTCDMVVNSHPLYQLSYAGILREVSPRTARMLSETGIGVKTPISL